jgi:hypothetical protein
VQHADEKCGLCHWQPDCDYELEEAKSNVRAYGVIYRPSDVRFAPSRHPILGPKGEYAIDRVALRERAYLEFTAFAQQRGRQAELTPRLQSLLECVRRSDELYAK